ncbi:MAG: hypothetical protein J6Z33_07285, partial [Lachnospiraceae bacterium]|nr:hypothetical protein [Lachnospiraceae bacterium]
MFQVEAPGKPNVAFGAAWFSLERGCAKPETRRFAASPAASQPCFRLKRQENQMSPSAPLGFPLSASYGYRYVF